MQNPWKDMTIEDGRAMDQRKEQGSYRFSTQVIREALWNIIQEYLPKDRSSPILDLGGGTGIWALRIAAEGYPVVLTDISPGLLDRAREKIQVANLGEKIRIQQADMCDLSAFGDCGHVLVLALGDPLSYCDDADQALREIHRVTAEDGILIGDVENRYRAALSTRRATCWKDAKKILLEGWAHWPEQDNPAPIRQFTPSEIKQLLVATDWTVIDMHPGRVLWSLVSEQILQEATESDETLGEMVDLEQQLREDPALLGCGTEIQFVARKPAQSA